MSQLLTNGWPAMANTRAGVAPLPAASLRAPKAVETGVLRWLIDKHGAGRPPTAMAKLLAMLVIVNEQGLSFDRRTVAEALELNLYTQDSMLRSALEAGHIAAYYLPSPELVSVVNAARLLVGAC
jgi:hypothetical protein